MFKILGNIYDIFIAIVIETVFFGTFLGLRKIVFWQKKKQKKKFKILISFYL